MIQIVHNEKIDRLVADAKKLFSDQLWNLNMDNLSKAKQRLIKFVKLIRITFNEFAEGRMGFQCVALSYFGALAIIPFVSFLFAVTGGLGLSDRLLDMMQKLVSANPDAVKTIMEKAGNIINTAKSGGVGLISALLFLWTIIWLMFQVERVFNNVWKIRKIHRRMYKRFSFYIGALLLSPVIVMIFGSGIALYSNITGYIGMGVNIRELSTILTIVGWIAFYVLMTLLLSIMYKFIPAVNVKYSNAFWAAVVAAFVFTVFQYLYLETQVFVTRLNDVYGVLAAVPLFLIWMNFSWQIIIYGAQLSYGLQNVESYNIPEGDLKDFTPVRDRMKNQSEQDFMDLNEL